MKPKVRRLLKALRLRPEEAHHARRFTRGLFLLGACTSLGTVAAESLLLGRAGADWLPVAFLANQAAILAVAAAYLRWGRDARAELPFRALGLIAASLATFSGFELGGHEVNSALLLFAVVHSTSAMLLVHFHNVRGLLMDAQTTKVVLPRILPFFLVGKVAGGLLATISGYIDVSMWGPIYGLSVLLTSWALATPFRNVTAPPPPAVPGLVAIGWSSLWRNPFPRWALIAAFFVVLTERTLEMSAGAMLAQHTDPASLAKLLGWFTAVAAMFAGAAQAFFVAPIVSHFGPARGAVLFPFFSLVTMAGSYVVHGVPGALMLRFAHSFLPPAMVDPTYGLLEGSLPVRLARNVRVLKTGLMRPIATVTVALGAALLHGYALPAAAFCALVLFVLALAAPRLYARACLELVKDRGTSRADLRTYRVPTVEAQMWREAGQMLAGEDMEGADAALDLVEATGTPEAVSCAAAVLHETRSSTVKARIVEVLGRLGWKPDAKMLARVADEAPVVRAEVFLCRASSGEILHERARAEIERKSGSFARVAAAGFQLSHEPGNQDLIAILEDALRAKSASRVRLALRSVHRAGGGVAAELVVEASRRRELRVRRAAVGPLRLLKQADRLEELARTDLSPTVRGAAFEALEKLDRTRALAVAPALLADPSSRVREPVSKLLLRYARTGMRILRRLARDPLMRWSVREEALLTIARTRPNSPFHHRVGEREAERAAWLHALRNRLPERSGSVGIMLSRALLEDEVVISIYISLRALTTHLGEIFFDAIVEAIRSPRRAVRAQGLESLASHLSGAPPEELVVLVRTIDYLARLQIGSSMPGEPLEVKGARDWGDGMIWLPEGVKSERSGGAPSNTPEAQELAGEHLAVVRELLPRSDPYLAAALLWAMHDLGATSRDVKLEPEVRDHAIVRETLDWLHSPMYPEGMPTLARLAFLKGTELFVGFGAEELHLVAQVAHSEKFEKGEALFRQGDAASELHVVVRGKIRIQLEHAGACTVLDTIGPEDMLGEQGVFDGQSRSASAIAIEPVETLSLTRSDLTELLAQSPAVALAFLRTLSLRLRRASQQLAAARAPVTPPSATPAVMK